VTGRVFTYSPRVDTGSRGGNFRRADILFDGLDQAGPSFEARVFLNNPLANKETDTTPENGYVGSLHVYGLWPEGSKETAVQEGGSRQPRAPMTRYITATEPIRVALAEGDTVWVTVVAVPYGESQADLDLNLGSIQVAIVVDHPSPGSNEPPRGQRPR
jgi:hypothetical protein